MEQNYKGFITVAICGGYISKYPRLILVDTSIHKFRIIHVFKNAGNAQNKANLSDLKAATGL